MKIPISTEYCNEKGRNYNLIYEVLENNLSKELLQEIEITDQEGSSINNYGIKITETCDGFETVCEIRDISINKENIEGLIIKMAKGCVTPTTAKDIVEDYIAV